MPTELEYRASIAAEVAEPFEAAARYPGKEPRGLFGHLYAKPPTRVTQQGKALLRSIKS